MKIGTDGEGGGMTEEGKLGAMSEPVVCRDNIKAQRLDSTHSGRAVSGYDHPSAALSRTSS
jgi:hypothetical protein